MSCSKIEYQSCTASLEICTYIVVQTFRALVSNKVKGHDQEIDLIVGGAKHCIVVHTLFVNCNQELARTSEAIIGRQPMAVRLVGGATSSQFLFLNGSK